MSTKINEFKVTVDASLSISTDGCVDKDDNAVVQYSVLIFGTEVPISEKKAREILTSNLGSEEKWVSIKSESLATASRIREKWLSDGGRRRFRNCFSL